MEDTGVDNTAVDDTMFEDTPFEVTMLGDVIMFDDTMFDDVTMFDAVGGVACPWNLWAKLETFKGSCLADLRVNRWPGW